MQWCVDKSSAGESLFVIKRPIVNVGKVPSAGIRIQANLPCYDNEALAENAAFAGNMLDEAALRQVDLAEIERALSNTTSPDRLSAPHRIKFSYIDNQFFKRSNNLVLHFRETGETNISVV